jgi:hypothetical protein
MGEYDLMGVKRAAARYATVSICCYSPTFWRPRVPQATNKSSAIRPAP